MENFHTSSWIFSIGNLLLWCLYIVDIVCDNITLLFYNYFTCLIYVFIFVGINLSKLKLQREFHDVAMKMMMDYAFVFGLVECYYLVS